MDPNSQVTLAQVVANIVQQAAVSAAIVAPITFGIGELVKKITIKGNPIPTWIAGFMAPIIGVLTLFLVNGFHFTSLGILVGILAGLATSGAYSTVKSAATSSPVQPSPVTVPVVGSADGSTAQN